MRNFLKRLACIFNPTTAYPYGITYACKDVVLSDECWMVLVDSSNGPVKVKLAPPANAWNSVHVVCVEYNHPIEINGVLLDDTQTALYQKGDSVTLVSNRVDFWTCVSVVRKQLEY
jgi:hypothetical protein